MKEDSTITNNIKIDVLF